MLPQPKRSPKGGRKLIENRRVLEGILWMLWTGAPWKELPKRYSSGSACWRRLKQWEDQGVWLEAWRAFLAELDAEGQLDWSECFADGSFAPAKEGALRRDDQAGQGHEADGGGRWPGSSFGPLPGLGLPTEVTLLGTTLANAKVPRRGWGWPRTRPRRIIADKGCGSDAPRDQLARRGIDRKTRRYKRRWKVERTFAWLGNYRRLVVRWDRDLTIYNAFFHLACLMITLRQL